MTGRPINGVFVNDDALTSVGLNSLLLGKAICGTYDLLDAIDRTLSGAGAFPLSQTVELANLSSMIGNIFSSEIAKHSRGIWRRNGPHKYPDLLSTKRRPDTPDLELKMALEANKPKGHLSKRGHYIICRYVLCGPNGSFTRGKDSRGITPYIWELRVGYLHQHHFNESNTTGDSGKTAVVNAEGMAALKIVYVDLARIPMSHTGALYDEYRRLAPGDRR